MARERSHVKKRRRGCMGGCLTKIILLLGLAAILFVGACVLGFVQNDPVTGVPSFSLEPVQRGGMQLPDMSGLAGAVSGGLQDAAEMAQDVKLPSWAYGVSGEGLTIKTLRAGDGESVLVCCDGYTMLIGGGSGMGFELVGQLLLCGVKHLNAVVAPSAEQAQIGGLPLAITLMPPQYLLMQSTQVKGRAYNRLVDTAEKNAKIQVLTPQQGLTFSLGRATVTVIGPTYTAHTDQRDDGLSVRVDFGSTSALIMGPITENGERELIGSGARIKADALICASGGSEAATGTHLVEAARPAFALMTGKEAANSVMVRLTRSGAQVYTAQEHGVMTLVSDGQTMQIRP